MDNLSTDDTVEIVRDLAHSIPIELRHQSDDTYSQSLWVTEMARAAAMVHGADWEINNDADEFWMFPDFDVCGYIKGFAADISCVALKRHNAVLIENSCWNGFDAHPSSSVLFERQSLNQLGSPLPGKCLHRASSRVTVQQGNHAVSGLSGGLVHCDAACILHFPYRGFEQYQSKIRLGGAAYARNKQLQPGIGSTWREQHKIVDHPDLVEFWSSLQRSTQRCIRAEMRGELFREPRLRSCLQRLLFDWQTGEIKRASRNLLQDSAQYLHRYVGRVESAVHDDATRPRSLPFNNLPFLARVRFITMKASFKFLESLNSVDPCSRFTDLRNLVSLFP